MMMETTDHAAPSHLEEAVTWYAANLATVERPIVPALRRRFGISPKEACEVIRAANLRLDWGGANA